MQYVYEFSFNTDFHKSFYKDFMKSFSILLECSEVSPTGGDSEGAWIGKKVAGTQLRIVNTNHPELLDLLSACANKYLPLNFYK